jgi:hypothetical protein
MKLRIIGTSLGRDSRELETEAEEDEDEENHTRPGRPSFILSLGETLMFLTNETLRFR